MRAPDRPDLAIVRYGLADYEIQRPGRFVLCAVTGELIPIGELLYWSAARQEAYKDAVAATKALTGAG